MRASFLRSFRDYSDTPVGRKLGFEASYLATGELIHARVIRVVHTTKDKEHISHGRAAQFKKDNALITNRVVSRARARITANWAAIRRLGFRGSIAYIVSRARASTFESMIQTDPI